MKRDRDQILTEVRNKKIKMLNPKSDSARKVAQFCNANPLTSCLIQRILLQCKRKFTIAASEWNWFPSKNYRPLSRPSAHISSILSKFDTTITSGQQRFSSVQTPQHSFRFANNCPSAWIIEEKGLQSGALSVNKSFASWPNRHCSCKESYRKSHPRPGGEMLAHALGCLCKYIIAHCERAK